MRMLPDGRIPVQPQVGQRYILTVATATAAAARKRLGQGVPTRVPNTVVI